MTIFLRQEHDDVEVPAMIYQHPNISETIPTHFNPYKYHVYNTISLYYQTNSIHLWIKTSLKRCSCGKQTPYVYKYDYYWNKYRVCGRCMPREVKDMLMKIYR